MDKLLSIWIATFVLLYLFISLIGRVKYFAFTILRCGLFTFSIFHTSKLVNSPLYINSYIVGSRQSYLLLCVQVIVYKNASS